MANGLYRQWPKPPTGATLTPSPILFICSHLCSPFPATGTPLLLLIDEIWRQGLAAEAPLCFPPATGQGLETFGRSKVPRTGNWPLEGSSMPLPSQPTCPGSETHKRGFDATSPYACMMYVYLAVLPVAGYHWWRRWRIEVRFRQQVGWCQGVHWERGEATCAHLRGPQLCCLHPHT